MRVGTKQENQKKQKNKKKQENYNLDIFIIIKRNKNIIKYIFNYNTIWMSINY